MALRVMRQDIRVAAVPDLREGLLRLSRWLASSKRKPRLSVWLSGELCQPAVVPAIEGVRDRSEAELAALAWLQARGWPSSIWEAKVSEWPCPGAHWPLAVVQSQLLQSLADSFGGKLRSVRPWWSWAVRQVQTTSATTPVTVCALDGRALTVCRLSGEGGLITAHTSASMPDEASAQRSLLRQQMQGGNVSSFRLRWPESGEAERTYPVESESADADGFAFATWVEHAANA